MSKKSQKICFIVFVSIFAVLWVGSMVMLGLAAFNAEVTESIESWYASKHPADPTTGKEAETLNLFKVTAWASALSTAGLLITLLFKELKKKYRVR